MTCRKADRFRSAFATRFAWPPARAIALRALCRQVLPSSGCCDRKTELGRERASPPLLLNPRYCQELKSRLTRTSSVGAFPSIQVGNAVHVFRHLRALVGRRPTPSRRATDRAAASLPDSDTRRCAGFEKHDEGLTFCVGHSAFLALQVDQDPWIARCVVLLSQLIRSSRAPLPR
jgi:hypothetical protein